MKRTAAKRRSVYRHNQTGADRCWRLTQKYDRYLRTGDPIGACQSLGSPDLLCPLFGGAVFRVGRLGRNRACTACGRYWIS